MNDPFAITIINPQKEHCASWGLICGPRVLQVSDASNIATLA